MAAAGQAGGGAVRGDPGGEAAKGDAAKGEAVKAEAAEPDEAFGTLPKLKLAAFLAGCTEAEFGTVSEACAIAAPTLSKTASALEEVGYVRIRKGHVGRRPRTWLSLTAPGRSAFDRHMAALSHLTEVARIEAARIEAARSEAARAEPAQASATSVDGEPVGGDSVE